MTDSTSLPCPICSQDSGLTPEAIEAADNAMEEEGPIKADCASCRRPIEAHYRSETIEHADYFDFRIWWELMPAPEPLGDSI